MQYFNRILPLVAIAIAMVYAVVQPGCAWACSCLPPGPPEQELDRAAAVFAGRVVNIDPPSGQVTNSADQIRVMFDVSNVWKGDISAETTVTTMGDSAACGFNFEEGQEYLVYTGTDENGNLQVSLCSRTNTLQLANEDLTALGEGTPPSEPSPEVAEPTAAPTNEASGLPGDTNLAALVAIGGVGILAVSFVGYTLWKRS